MESHSSRGCSRRRYLALSTGYFAATCGLTSNTSEAAPAGLHRVRRTGRALGTEVTFTLLHGDRAHATATLERSFAELESIEEVLSLYRPESQVCRLNANGHCARPHPHLLRVLTFATEISRRSRGAFDVTVQPLWKAYQEAKRQGRRPSKVEIETARAKIGWERVTTGTSGVRLEGEGSEITLNGIAQATQPIG